jgi:copper chaperone CopZ
MHCANCSRKVESVLSSIPGVIEARVTLPHRGVVTSHTQIPLAVLEEAVRSAGAYDVALGRTSFIGTLRPFAPLGFMFLLVIVWAAMVSYFFPSHHAQHDFMRHFMGGFFLLFGMLKMIDLKMFARMYQEYDVVAKRIPWWGYLYPFVEVGLGILYTLNMFPVGTNGVTAVLMSVGVIGIVQKLRRGGDVQCACLGSAFTVPLTWVTVAENVLMVVMALSMLVLV